MRGRAVGLAGMLGVVALCAVLAAPAEAQRRSAAGATLGYATAESRYGNGKPVVRVVVNGYGCGPAHAIRYGIHQAEAPVVVVTMADGCDDPRQIDDLTRLVERGVVVAAASRYMPGGQQVGGPVLKRAMSGTAGRTLYWFARIGTRDATNSFKAYQREFVERVGIDSRDGFEIGLELTAKARRMRLPVAEIPTIWLDRALGVSNFKLWSWLPRYFHWYLHAFGPKDALPDFNAMPIEVPRDEIDLVDMKGAR